MIDVNYLKGSFLEDCMQVDGIDYSGSPLYVGGTIGIIPTTREDTYMLLKGALPWGRLTRRLYSIKDISELLTIVQLVNKGYSYDPHKGFSYEEGFFNLKSYNVSDTYRVSSLIRRDKTFLHPLIFIRVRTPEGEQGFSRDCSHLPGIEDMLTDFIMHRVYNEPIKTFTDEDNK